MAACSEGRVTYMGLTRQQKKQAKLLAGTRINICVE